MKPAQSAPSQKSRTFKIAKSWRRQIVFGIKNFSSAESVSVEPTAPVLRPASKPSPASPAPLAAQYIDKESPSGTAYFGRAAPDAVPEISICQNRQRTFRKRAVRCHRRGNALRPSAPKRRNIGPWLTSSFAVRIVPSNGIKVLAAANRPAISSMFKRSFDVPMVFRS